MENIYIGVLSLVVSIVSTIFGVQAINNKHSRFTVQCGKYH
jgi:hypothetical protein